MKKRWIFLIVLGLLALTCALGPVTRVEEPDRSVLSSIPLDVVRLPVYLAERERSVSGVTEGAEKLITWATEPTQTPLSIVYIHGFSATRQETAPLSQSLAKALGANLFETRLTGHGQPGEFLAQASAKDWLEDTLEAITIGEHIGQKVIIVATSTGATLALWLATQPESKFIHSMILISPNLGPKAPEAALLSYPWMNMILPLFIPMREWTPRNEQQQKYWTTSYPSKALFPMQALVEYVREIDASKVQTPTMFIYNEADDVIDANEVRAFYDKLSNQKKTLTITPKDGEDAHVIAGDIVSPSQTKVVEEQILSFIRDAKNRNQ
jgi:esterase/lipase